MELDDPLARSTARLSISLADGENARSQVAELLREAGPNSRRDSAVSLTSFEEDPTGQAPSLSLLKKETHTKRRRSSAQSLAMKEPKEKLHKKKIKKAGQAVSLQLFSKPGKPLPFKNLRDLIISTFCTHETSTWYTLTNPAAIPRVVFCLVPGLPHEVERGEDSVVTMDKVKNGEDFEFLSQNFDKLVCSTCPGSKDSIYLPLQTLTNISLTKKEKKELLDKLKANKITIKDLLMTPEQLRQSGYPLQTNEGWVQTTDFDHEGSHIFALDCEFCKSAKGKELTRISLINFQGETVMDLFVKPSEEITDYVTKYSGITEAKLEGVTTTLADIQQQFTKIVSSTDILIGHSLDSDLNVMKIVHTEVVDTSVIYEHTRGPPLKPSLKWLAQKFLARNIQEGETNGDGHSSVEDAQACLDLVKMKISEGSCHGTNVNEVSIFQRLARTSREPLQSLWINYSQFQEQENYSEPAENKVTHAYVKNDDDVVDAVSSRGDPRFTVLSLRELEFNIGWTEPPVHYTGLCDTKFRDPSANRSELYKRTNDRLAKIYHQLPENSMMIVHSTVGSPLEMFRLQNIKREFQRAQRENSDKVVEAWDFDTQLALLEACNRARESVTFLKVKNV